MFKKKLPQWSMLPAEVEVTHFYGILQRAILFKKRQQQKFIFKLFFLSLCIIFHTIFSNSVPLRLSGIVYSTNLSQCIFNSLCEFREYAESVLS
jgi:hypothetical protein